MGLQRNHVPDRSKTGAVALFALAATVAVSACRSSETPASVAPPVAPATSDEATTEASGTAVPGMLADRFADDTPRQIELRDTALSLLELNQIDMAITALLSLRDEGPMSEARASGMLLLSELYYQADRVDDALEVLEALRPASPPQGKLEYLLGRTYRRVDRLVESEDALRRAVRLEPDFLRSYLALIAMLNDLGRQSDASEIELALERQIQLLAGRALEGTEDERVAAIEALGQAFADERLTRALVPVLSDPNPVLVVAAATSLWHVGTPSALPAMREARTAAINARAGAIIDQAIVRVEARQTPAP
jgi:tetratricopeptide (TPR) repeat protein